MEKIEYLEVIKNLVMKMNYLENQINELRNSQITLAKSDSLIRLWDNEADEIWNEY